eukprot:2895614-Pyramimonas_sp.AAC.2
MELFKGRDCKASWKLHTALTFGAHTSRVAATCWAASMPSRSTPPAAHTGCGGAQHRVAEEALAAGCVSGCAPSATKRRQYLTCRGLSNPSGYHGGQAPQTPGQQRGSLDVAATNY